jgi:tetratricopeptide (TPR) repeat protein
MVLVRKVWVPLAVLSAALIAVVVVRSRTVPPASQVASPDPVHVTAGYTGSAVCAECHAGETAAWKGSQHAGAMAPATAQTVLGRFDRATFTYAGVTSTFFTRDGRYYVRTDGADGTLTDFEVAYTFGLYPLQQYLVPMPGGRLQALSIAWDARPAEAGGQRWFHLYPGEHITASDPLHWTGRHQNWNFMCADCHTTNLRKGYDAASKTFSTTWTELGVGCEACHGPGSTHVTLMRGGGPRPAGLGLTASLDERRPVAWTIDAATGAPARSVPRATEHEIEVCARCHARRSQMTDAAIPGAPFEDSFRASLLDPALFRVDGQPTDEVYNYQAFLQSKMHAKGVTCGDCHDPHRGSLWLTGNATCTQCHAAPRYDTPGHTMHAANSPGAACATCHMPVSTFMVIDPRHDHSFRVPRPDRTDALGVPNVCTAACHAGKPAAWAADAIRRHNPHPAAGYQSFAEAFAAAARHAPDAGPALAAIVRDASMPALVRASAIERLTPSPEDLATMTAQLQDASPLVRRAAVGWIGRTDEGTRLARLPRLLSDPVRSVRVEAALALVDLADGALAGADRQAFDRAFDEFVAEQRYNADRPEAQANLGQALLQRGRLDEAQAAFDEAIRLDRAFVPAYVNLGELYRVRGDEDAAERALRAGLAVDPRAAVLHHALGLSLVRRHRAAEAVPAFARAAALDPANARYAYVYAVALHDTGRAADAIDVLRAAAAKWPSDRAIADALAQYAAR